MIPIFRPKPKSNLSSQPVAGIYVSKQGKSVYSKNRDDFIFIPDRPSVSIKKRLTLKTVQSTSDLPFPFTFNDIIEGTAIYKHGFGYIPEVIAFVTTAPMRYSNPFDTGNSYVNVPSTWNSGDDIIGGQHFEVFNCYADDENVYVTAVRYTIVPQVGVYNVAATYNFDILLLMEEAK